MKRLVDAKRKGKALPEEEPEAPRPKVVNIMDALRNSLAERKNPKRTTAKESTGAEKERVNELPSIGEREGVVRSNAELHFSANAQPRINQYI